MKNVENIVKAFTEKNNKEKSLKVSRFFKTNENQYGAGDKFLGITVPEARKICKENPLRSLAEIKILLKNEFHEIRYAGLVYLRDLYIKSDTKNKKLIIDFYIKNSKLINNWDLVDTSAPYILGDYLLKNKNQRNILFELSESSNLWQKRIAIVSCWALLKNSEFEELEKISIKYLDSDEDLIHKATGWMLRESGKIDKNFLINFLNIYANKMPRTMLRYSIEKLNQPERKKYLNK